MPTNLKLMRIITNNGMIPYIIIIKKEYIYAGNIFIPMITYTIMSKKGISNKFTPDSH